MDVAAKVSFLRDEMTKPIDELEKRRRKDRGQALIFRVATVILSALITILLGLKVGLGLSQALSNIALVLGALATVVGAIDAFYDPRGLWIRRSVLLSNLKSLERRLNYLCAGSGDSQVDPREVEAIFAQLDEIFDEDLRAWLRLRGEAEGGFNKEADPHSEVT